MTPEKYLDDVLTYALDKAGTIVADQTDYSVRANLDRVAVSEFNIDNSTARAQITWRMIPVAEPTKAFDIPTALRFEVDTDVEGLAVRVTDMRVVARGGCEIEIAGVGTIVSGEDYTGNESAGHAIDLVNYVNHQVAIAETLWEQASVMASF